MFGKNKDAQASDKPFVDVLVDAFTRGAGAMNAIAGFSGILLLASIFIFIVLALPQSPLDTGIGLPFALTALAGSIVTYLLQYYVNLRSAQERSRILESYGRLLMEKYLAGLDRDVKAENIYYIQNEILGPLFMSSQADLNKPMQ